MKNVLDLAKHGGWSFDFLGGKGQETERGIYTFELGHSFGQASAAVGIKNH
jgi:hypothetical protein